MLYARVRETIKKNQKLYGVFNGFSEIKNVEFVRASSTYLHIMFNVVNNEIETEYWCKNDI